MVVRDSLDFVNRDGAHDLDAVGTVALPCWLTLAAATRLLCDAFRVLVLVVLGGAVPGERIPNCIGIVRVVKREREHAQVVASNKVPKLLVVQIARPRSSALRCVVGVADTEVHSQIVQRLCCTSRNLVPDDARDSELPGFHPHDLVVQIPQGASKISNIDVLDIVIILACRAIDIEGEEGRLARLLQLLRRLVWHEGAVPVDGSTLGEVVVGLLAIEARVTACGAGVIGSGSFVIATTLLVTHTAVLRICIGGRRGCGRHVFQPGHLLGFFVGHTLRVVLVHLVADVSVSAAGGPVVPLAAALLVGFCTDRILGMGFAGIRCRCHRILLLFLLLLLILLLLFIFALLL
mmetsp:Transcript_5694/g.13471  ORF Transcript_5694/g.13471 Transcript_5694/m.13471 type:complete len:349 (-) Transcript_5694:361-1407(-)